MPGYGSDRISGFDNDTADQIKYLEGLIKKYGETSEKAINLRKQIEDLKNKELDEILDTLLKSDFATLVTDVVQTLFAIVFSICWVDVLLENAKTLLFRLIPDKIKNTPESRQIISLPAL